VLVSSLGDLLLVPLEGEKGRWSTSRKSIGEEENIVYGLLFVYLRVGADPSCL
jgi:hypothetical protein